VILWAIRVSVTSPGLKTRESVSQTVLEGGGLAQNSTVRDRRWPVVAVKVLLAGYTSGRPESTPTFASILFQGQRLILKLTVLRFKRSKEVLAFWPTSTHRTGRYAERDSRANERSLSVTQNVGIVHTGLPE
jgi:hypothetical protein